CVLDDLKDGYAWGWAIDRDDPGRVLHMDIIINGEKIGEAVCSNRRPDVKNAGYPTEIVGYKFKIPEHYLDGARHRLEFKSAITGKSYPIYNARGRLEYYEFSD